MAPTDSIAIKLVKNLPLPAYLLSVARVPGKEEIFAGDSEGRIHHVDMSAAKPQPVFRAGHVSYVSGLVLTGKCLISAGSDRKIAWWDAATRQPIRSVENAHRMWIRHLALSPDGRIAASVADDMVCRLWDVEAGKVVRELRGHPEKIRRHSLRSKLFTCTFSPDGKYIATADQEGRILIWETGSGKLLVCCEAHTFFEWDDNSARLWGHSFGGVRSLAFSPDSKLLAAGGIENTDVAIIKGTALVQVFDWQTGEKTHEFKGGGNGMIENLHFHHRGKWLLGAVGAGEAGKLLFYDLEQKKILKEIAVPMSVFGMTVNETSDVVDTVGCARGGVSDGAMGKVGTEGRIVQWDLRG
jgi:WD40 repeat protein